METLLICQFVGYIESSTNRLSCKAAEGKMVISGDNQIQYKAALKMAWRRIEAVLGHYI